MSDAVVDFHNHLRPKVYVDTLIESGISKVKIDENGNRYLIDNNVLMTKLPEELVFGESDLEKRIEEMEKAGVAMQTLSVPRSHDFEAPVAPKLCKIINDAFAKIIALHPEIFAGLASLPLNDVGASVAELVRAMTQLELHGVSIGGNLNGIALDDERFFPLYEKMNELETVVFIHPGLPPWGKSGLEKYYLWAALGYQFDTVVAASTLMYGGVLDLFPKIKFVFSHLGGGLPFLVHRLTGTAKDRGSVDPSGKIKAQKKAKDYLKSVYYDTSVSDLDSFQQSFRCTYEFAGGDNILFGSDYPWYDWEFISKLKGAIERMDIPNNDKGKILGGNAKKLLKIS